MAMPMRADLLTKTEWNELRRLSRNLDKPSGDIALKLLKDALKAASAERKAAKKVAKKK